MLTGKAALPLVIVLGSLIAASYYLKNRSAESANMVPMPMIGEVNKVNREGPWPECVGLTSDACAELIDAYTTDVEEIELADELISPNGFNPKRVVIFVDKEGVVTRIPHKG